MATIVHPAQYRNMIDRVMRQVRVDYQACKGAAELLVWRDTLQRTMAEAGTLATKRPNPADIRRMADALTTAHNLIARV